MKMSSRFNPTELTAASWPVYDECAETLGMILDNKFERPHVHVYEHVRHTSAEVFNHPPFPNDGLGISLDGGTTALAEEERDVRGALLIDERHRRLNVIGDVGVGKSTFLQHLIELHVGQDEFPGRLAIYLDWNDVAVSSQDAMPEVQRRFVNRVLKSLESHHGLPRLRALDAQIFETAELFARDRVLLDLEDDPGQRASSINRAIREAWLQTPVDFVFERINALCLEDRNALLLVVDNIDHLAAPVLEKLLVFLTEVQVRATPLLVVAMRDHTYIQGSSSYQPDKIVPAWHTRLKPPDIRLMLERRIRYFFPTADQLEEGAPPGTRRSGARVRTQIDKLRIDMDMQNVCRSLLHSPLSDVHTYDFICNYANFNIRELFTNLQRILGCPGYAGYDKRFFKEAQPVISLGIDNCLIALGLDRYLMFFPEKSRLFNPYSAGNDVQPTDKVVGVRILQMLTNRLMPLTYGELLSRFTSWGYNRQAVESQMLAMLHKDLLWTTTGAPADFSERSQLRLSYRGQLYARRIVMRTVFNYMMSFDVEMLDDAVQVAHVNRKQVEDELRLFARFDTPMPTDLMVARVLRMAAAIHEAERQEVKDLVDARARDQFRADVAPRCISADMVGSLKNFMVAVVNNKLPGSRYVLPSTAVMKQVSDIHERYCLAFGKAWGS